MPEHKFFCPRCGEETMVRNFLRSYHCRPCDFGVYGDDEYYEAFWEMVDLGTAAREVILTADWPAHREAWRYTKELLARGAAKEDADAG